jgi:hypothetical protein
MVALLLATGSLASIPARASGPCYHLHVYYRQRVIMDKWVGMGCWPGAQLISTSSQTIGDTVVEASQYAGR